MFPVFNRNIAKVYFDKMLRKETRTSVYLFRKLDLRYMSKVVIESDSSEREK